MIKLLIIGFSFFHSPSEKDSLGVETINGKMFVIHKVEEKETLYAISRRYGSSVDEIKQFNAGAASGLEIGQILKVPYTPKQSTVAKNGSVHKVGPKETLFSISKQYGLTMDELKQLNNLTDNSLSIGQELVVKKGGTSSKSPVSQNTSPVSANSQGVHIVGQKETLYSIARQYNVTVDQLKQWNTLATNDLHIGQTLAVADPSRTKAGTAVKQEVNTRNTNVRVNDQVAQETQKEERKDPVVARQETATKEQPPVKEEPKVQTIKISEAVSNGNEIVEAGVAELIEGTEGNRKYLALHRTAPVGTILKVRNEMNNREVFVRVMGKLPETAYTDKVVIKISKSAYDRLGAIDPKFRVEVTYYK
jgi:LysM repeat protein